MGPHSNVQPCTSSTLSHPGHVRSFDSVLYSQAPLHQARAPFDMYYAHYAVMGGFVVDISHIHNYLHRLTLTPKAVAFLAKHGHFLQVSHYTINDKSKADLLAKGLVLLQVCWILFQTLTRRITGLPITLLELHTTLIHVAMALTMYGLWFRKPMDVRDPTWVDPTAFQDLLALMLVRSYGLGHKFAHESREQPLSIKSSEHALQTRSESSYLKRYSLEAPNTDEAPIASIESSNVESLTAPQPFSHHRPHFWQQPAPEVTTHESKAEPSDYTVEQPFHAPTICTLRSGQALGCGIGPALQAHCTDEDPPPQKHEGRISIPLSARDVWRWELAAQGVRRSGEPLHIDSRQSSVNYFTFAAPNIFLDRKGIRTGFYAYFCAWASGGLTAALAVCVF